MCYIKTHLLSFSLLITAILTLVSILCPLNSALPAAAPLPASGLCLATTEVPCPEPSSTTLQSEVIRLHILADSDTKEAQTLKLLVRDSLLPYLNKLTSASTSKEEALSALTEHCDELKEIAEETLRREHADYSVTVSVTSCYFPVRIYGSQTYLSKDAVIFPPGVYDTVQVVLGAGEGHNWWCLAYPSLCFIDASYDYLPRESEEYLNTFSKVPKSKLHKLFYGGFTENFHGEERNALLQEYEEKDASEEVDVVAKSKLLELLKELLATFK